MLIPDGGIKMVKRWEFLFFSGGEGGGGEGWVLERGGEILYEERKRG